MYLNYKLGMFIGLAIGDSLGAPLEFEEPSPPDNYLTEYAEGGWHNVSKGEWTDDTSMALAMATSLIEKKGFDANDIMDNFCKWYEKGEFGTRDYCFDIGNSNRMALEKYLEDKTTPYKGNTSKETSGNGALMRLAPVIMIANNPHEAIKLATQQTLLTHGSELCVQYSMMLAEELYHGYACKKYDEFKLNLDINRNDVMSGGFVKETYECAWWAFETTNTFEDCIIKAVNRGHDSDTVGAVAGMIAGRHYGLSKIPHHYKRDLMFYDKLVEVGYKLCRMEI